MNAYFEQISNPKESQFIPLFKVDTEDILSISKWIKQNSLYSTLRLSCFIRFSHIKKTIPTASVHFEPVLFFPLTTSAVSVDKQRESVYPFRKWIHQTDLSEIELFFSRLFKFKIKYNAILFEDKKNHNQSILEMIVQQNSNKPNLDTHLDHHIFQLLSTLKYNVHELLKDTDPFFKSNALDSTSNLKTNEIVEQTKQDIDKLRTNIMKLNVLSFNALIEASRLSEKEQNLKKVSQKINALSQENKHIIFNAQMKLKEMTQQIALMQSKYQEWAPFMKHHHTLYKNLLKDIQHIINPL